MLIIIKNDNRKKVITPSINHVTISLTIFSILFVIINISFFIFVFQYRN